MQHPKEARADGFRTDAQISLCSVALALLVPIWVVTTWDPRWSGLAGALLALTYGPFVFYSLKLFPVPLALATQAAALDGAGSGAAARHTALRAGLAGICLGLACTGAGGDAPLRSPGCSPSHWPYRSTAWLQGPAPRRRLTDSGDLFLAATVSGHRP